MDRTGLKRRVERLEQQLADLLANGDRPRGGNSPRNSAIYQRVVREWATTSEVAKAFNIRPTTVTVVVNAAFRRAHPKVWRLLFELRGRSTPYLWHFRLYEAFGKIPNNPGSEGWSRSSRDGLLSQLQAYGIHTKKIRKP